VSRRDRGAVNETPTPTVATTARWSELSTTTTASQAEAPRPRKARTLRQRGPIEPIEQADFLRVPRPKLL
jgi:hypothetical protein